MFYALLLSLLLTLTLTVQQPPRVAVSAIQVVDGEFIDVQGLGYTPNRGVISHLLKPDQTEYPLLLFYANDRGEVSHTIDTMLLLPGTHELWFVDETTKAASERVRFTVGFGDASPAAPEVERVVESYGGVWRGNGGRNVPAVSSDVLITITGKPGLVAGTIAYPNLSCGGILGFRTVYKDAIELTETITFGADRCPSPGTVTLSLEENASLKFRWSDPKRTGTASGNLTSMKE